jgi:endonuclease-3
MKTRKERAEYVARKLDELYPEIPIPLDHADAYTLLIAVLLSAQCTDARVNMVTPGLFALADNPFAMAKLPVEQILEKIKTCGLANSKARNIKKLSEMLVEKYDGEVPQTFEQLEELPGVGHKTASVVMIHAFKIPAFPVDTHIHRLAQRWGLTKGKNVEQTEADCKRLWPPEDWEKLHLQIITYGREYCTARGCDGTKCEICRTTHPNRKKPFVANKA